MVTQNIHETCLIHFDVDALRSKSDKEDTVTKG